MKTDLVNRLRDYAAERKGEIADLVREAADAIEELQAGKWVSVEDRLPEFDDDGWVEWDGHYYSSRVLAVFEGLSGRGIEVSGETAICRDDGVWYWYDDDDKEESIVPILYWMPLPEPPKEGKQ